MFKTIYIFLKDWYIFILIFGIVLFLILGALINSNKTIQFDNPQITTCTFVKKSAKARGFSGCYAYIVDNVRFEVLDSYYATLLEGDKFNLIFEKNNPSKAKVIFYEPVFENGDSIQNTQGIITKFENESILGKSNVAFEYSVDGIKYQKYQFIDIERYTPKIGGRYKVKYLYSNPYNAIIYLNLKEN